MDNPMQGNFSNMGNMPSFPNGEMPSFPEGMEDFPFANGDFPSGMSGMQMPNFDFSGEMGDMDEMFHEDCDAISLTLNADIVETLAVGNIAFRSPLVIMVVCRVLFHLMKQCLEAKTSVICRQRLSVREFMIRKKKLFLKI